MYHYFIKAVIPLILVLVVNSANATILNYGTYVTDTETGLDWRKLEGTIGLSYNEVSAQMGAGGDFEGWRYARRSEYMEFFKNIFGSEPTIGDATTNNGITDAVAAYIGYTSEGVIYAITGDLDGGAPDILVYSLTLRSGDADTDIFYDAYETARDRPGRRGFGGTDYIIAGSLLVRNVPEPATWILVTLGLIGWVCAHRRTSKDGRLRLH